MLVSAHASITTPARAIFDAFINSSNGSIVLTAVGTVTGCILGCFTTTCCKYPVICDCSDCCSEEHCLDSCPEWSAWAFPYKIIGKKIRSPLDDDAANINQLLDRIGQANDISFAPVRHPSSLENKIEEINHKVRNLANFYEVRIHNYYNALDEPVPHSKKISSRFKEINAHIENIFKLVEANLDIEQDNRSQTVHEQFDCINEKLQTITSIIQRKRPHNRMIEDN